jgi:hypothetical protein
VQGGSVHQVRRALACLFVSDDRKGRRMHKQVLFTLAASMAPTVARAHAGHVAEVAGHGHIGAAVLIGGAIALGAIAAAKASKGKSQGAPAATEEGEPA